MKLTVKTKTLQDLVAKATKGASCNKMIPITGLMLVELDNNTLTLVTTDATNYLYVSAHKIEGEKFSVVVQVEVFAKLISKLTCEDVTLELADNKLTVKGNGTYVIELPLNEEGELVTYPNPQAKPDNIEPYKVQLSTIKLILSVAKSALATTEVVPCYTGYYVGDKVIATDIYKICGIDVDVLKDSALMSPELMNLFEVMTEEEITVYQSADWIIFQTSDCKIFGRYMDGKDDFSVDAINGLLSQEFKSCCKVSKADLLQLLDRLSLFVSPYDKNCIDLTFTPEGLQVSSKKSNSVEVIPFKESKDFSSFTCGIDIDMLTSQVKAHRSDIIEIQYGEDNAIKLPDGNITQVIGLLDE